MKSNRSVFLSLILAGLWAAAPALAAEEGNDVVTVSATVTFSAPTPDAAAAITGSGSLAGFLATSPVAAVKISDNYNPVAAGNAAASALQNANINSALKTGTATTAASGFNTTPTVVNSGSSVASAPTGSQAGPGSAAFVSPVPEPGDYALMLAGLLMLAAAVWNRRRAALPALGAALA